MESKASAGADFFSGSSEARDLMRVQDWSTSPLGPPAKWPQALRTVVRLMLGLQDSDVCRLGALLAQLNTVAGKPVHHAGG